MPSIAIWLLGCLFFIDLKCGYHEPQILEVQMMTALDYIINSSVYYVLTTCVLVVVVCNNVTKAWSFHFKWSNEDVFSVSYHCWGKNTSGPLVV